MSDLNDHHTKMMLMMPDVYKLKAIKYIRLNIPEDQAEMIKEDFVEVGDKWWAGNHFTWGMAVRNKLRENVCTDDKLPGSNWDGFYVPLVEIALGLREDRSDYNEKMRVIGANVVIFDQVSKVMLFRTQEAVEIYLNNHNGDMSDWEIGKYEGDSRLSISEELFGFETNLERGYYAGWNHEKEKEER
jgi:hypothetical protein